MLQINDTHTPALGAIADNVTWERCGPNKAAVSAVTLSSVSAEQILAELFRQLGEVPAGVVVQERESRAWYLLEHRSGQFHSFVPLHVHSRPAALAAVRTD